jgi:hypothetical protein
LELSGQAFDSLTKKLTSTISSRQLFPILRNGFQKTGGGKRDRTDDLLHAMQALSQLSYTPLGCCKFKKFACNRRALNYSPKIEAVSNG